MLLTRVQKSKLFYQAGFRPGRSTIDQVFLLSQSIWDGFQKKRPPERTVLATIDFSKAFDSAWHSALFYKLLTLSLPPCFVRWTRSFLSDRRANVLFRDARFESDAVSLRAPSLAQPSSSYVYVDNLAKNLSQGT